MEKKYLRIEDIMEEFSISRTTLWRMRKECGFPKGKRISKRLTVWPREKIENWINSELSENQT